MILKIIIASIVIYLVYVLYNKYILRENLNIENGKLLKMCKNKCDDTYKRCIQNHCNEVIESNHRKRRRANEKEDLQKKIDERRKCISKCSVNVNGTSAEVQEQRKSCNENCFKGEDIETLEKMKLCFTMCDEDHKDELDHDKCVGRCYTKNINLSSNANKIQTNVIKESFSIREGATGERDEEHKGANLNTAKTVVKEPVDKTMNYDQFKRHVSSKEPYVLPDSILRKLYSKMNNNSKVEEGNVYSYRIYLNDIIIDYKEFDRFASLNSLRVLSDSDRRSMFKRMDSSRTGTITYSEMIKKIDVIPMTFTFVSFVNIMKIYLRKLGILNEFRDLHYRRLFQIAKNEEERPNELIEMMNGSGNVVDATRSLNDQVYTNPMKPSDFVADTDVTQTRDYIRKDELDILLNPIIRDLKQMRVNKILERVLYDNTSNIAPDLNACKAIGRERIQLAPIINSDDMDNIVSSVTNRIIKCSQQAIPVSNKQQAEKSEGESITDESDKYRHTEELINSIGKDLINSGLFKSYVEKKCGFFCPADDKYIKDDKSLILPRDTRKGTVFDIWNPPSVNTKVTKLGQSMSGRDLSNREGGYWKQVPRKVLDKVCSDKNCVVKPHDK